ncbi:SAM-dependent methyltransferase [Vogesella facilis]|uniref:SAM-dependent methyltransferase n=1 Tax=Vogesella facilis TaxID=1655232 RepID=A0ABV7RBK7_9NEIS
MRLRAIARALLVQLLAAVLAWSIVAPLAMPWRWVALQLVAAGLLAWLAGVRGYGLGLHLLFMPAVLLALQLQLPGWLYLLGLLLCLALSRNALTEQVPLYLSSQESIAALVAALPAGARVLDLGSGDGRVVLQLAALRPDLTVCGVENALLPWLWSRWRYWRAGRPGNACLRFGSFWRLDWQPYDVVHAFLSPVPMARVWQQFQRCCHPGAILVSNTFMIQGMAPQQRLPLSGPLQTELLIWRHPHGTC